MNSNNQIVLTCPKGLEQVLAAEIETLGAGDIKPIVAAVNATADLETAYRICLWSRLASRVLWSLFDAPITTADDLYQCIHDFNWIEHFSDRNTFRVHFKGTSDEIRNTHFGALKVKDAICDYFRTKTGERPSISEKPDINIHVLLHRGQVKVSIDLAGESLHKRGYRQGKGAAPLKENLAVALLIRSGWGQQMKQPDAALVDPMCGSGTLLIEAALMAANIAPGILRKRFGFEHWKHHQAKIWRALIADAEEKKQQSAESEMELTLLGYDADLGVIQKAKDNAQRAGVSHFIHFNHQSLKDLERDKGLSNKGLILTNPPYGERLSDEVAIGALYASLGNKIKQHFPGWLLAIFTGNAQQAYQFKLRADKQYQFYNGAIPSTLFLYQVSDRVRPEPEKVASEQPTLASLSNGSQMVANRLRKNIKKIKSWAKKQETDCYRIYDADMPEYAVAIDIYGPYVHIQEYAPPKSVDPEKAEHRLREVLDAVPVAMNVSREDIYLKQRRVQKGKKQYEKQDQQQNFMEVREGSCQLYVNLADYLDTGLFLDHRPIRMDIEAWADGKDFLNLFAYTCTASVHAAMGGARSTTSVDMSTTYLNWGRKNLVLNGLSERHHDFVQADCIKWLEEQPATPKYDLIFMDPPTFSNSKRMMDIFDVQRDHVTLINQAMGLLRKGGRLIFSNNLKKFKIETEALSQYVVTDITAKSIPKDFERNSKIHQCYLIEHK